MNRINNSPPDSYVKVEIVNEKRHRKKTKTVKFNTNPLYEERFLNILIAEFLFQITP